MIMNVLLVDNYDSFTYNLLHILKELRSGKDNIDVIKNNCIDFDKIPAYDKIVLSPGPGIPSKSGAVLELVSGYAATKSILGVCLGHQAIGEVFGCKLIHPGSIYHGIQSEINIIGQDYIFAGLPSVITAGRYHSWIISESGFPGCLNITAIDAENQIMAISHKEYDLHGVQFHPESIMTPSGKSIMRNFIYNRR